MTSAFMITDKLVPEMLGNFSSLDVYIYNK
jgi:hypothetical protein